MIVWVAGPFMPLMLPNDWLRLFAFVTNVHVTSIVIGIAKRIM